MPKDILVVSENTSGGQDRVIGDVHGSVQSLRELLEAMGEHDRLFIVGDLVDKGEDSIAVMELLQQAKYKDKVFVVRGNHEDLCLRAIDSLEVLARAYYANDSQWLDRFIGGINTIASAKNSVAAAGALLGASFNPEDPFHQSIYQAIIDLRGHYVKNEGGWLAIQFLAEIRAGAIQFKPGAAGAAGATLEYDRTQSKVSLIKDYMSALPYIIHKQGKNPFHVVHADMPVNDEDLFKLIKSGKGLDEIFKRYAMWARENGSEDPMVSIKGRDGNSIMAVVGHNIVIGDVPAIRSRTNIVNIDLGAYSHGLFLVLNMTQGKAEYNKPTTDAHLLAVLAEVNQHLGAQFKRGLRTEIVTDAKQEAKKVKIDELKNELKQTEKIPASVEPATTVTTSMTPTVGGNAENERKSGDRKIILKPGAACVDADAEAQQKQKAGADDSLVSPINLRSKA